MNADPNGTKCPFCLTTVPIEARKCSSCGEWLKNRLWRDSRLSYLIWLVLLGVLYFAFSGTTPFGDTSGIKVSSHNWRVGDDQIVVLGELKNSGDTKNPIFTVTASFFDKDGNLVDVATDHQSGVFPKDSTRAFKITVGNCGSKGKLPVANYNRYELNIN